MRRLACMYAALSLLLFLSYPSFAQERTISGKIISDDNIPLVGVTVMNTSTNKKVLTNESGEYRITAQRGQKLSFVYVGFESKTITVGDAGVINVQLVAESNQLEEVTVAMDMKRSPKELGFSAPKVGGAEIQESQRENFVNGLQGRVAGLTITQTSGIAGASSSIVLRGFNSLSQSNQPLFVVDGVVMDNSSVDENSDGGRGIGMVERIGLTGTSNRNTDYQNRIADLNPNDIESITILKGPEATALYGSQASSGAIIITTRKAKSTKLAVQYDNSFRIQRITRFPKVFDAYSNGTNGNPSNIFRYFGPEYAEGTVLYDNLEAFFRTGFAQTHNIGADFGIPKSMFRFSGSFFTQDGVVPNNSFKRFNLRLSNTTKIGKKIDVTPSITYIRSENKKVLRSAGGFMLGLLVWPNVNNLQNFKNDNGAKIPVFAANAGNPNTEYDNPLFNVNMNKNYDETDRYNATLGINIRPYDWLTLSGRFGYEHYATDGYLRYHPLSYYITAATGGLQDNWYRRYYGYNHTITATAKRKLNKDFNGRIMVGTMWQDYETRMFAVSGSGIIDAVNASGEMVRNGVVITDKDLPNPADSNATKLSTRLRLLRNNFGEFNKQIIRQFAYFGEVSVNFRNYIFLTYTHRFESASTLPAKNRDFNYPGASISMIMTDMIPGLKNIGINYWKLRTSLASTARLNAPYSTQSVFVNSQASGGGFSYGFNNANPDLEPEKQKTYEVGTELRFARNRVGLDITYYNTLNEDQIFDNMRASYGTGFVLNNLNAGSTRNQGVEISVDASVVKKKNLTWDVRLNFNKMWNEVIVMPQSLSEYYLADTWLYGNARGGLMLGGPTTTITAFGYQRNIYGDILINPTNGLPVIEQLFKVRGDRNPDFTMGLNNLLRYKNWRVNFLWDMKVGGDVFNGTEMFMTSAGRSYRTADRLEPRVINGVLNDGLQNSANPTRNTIAVIPQYNDAYYTAAIMPEEAFIEKDVNWLRLRELTISYVFPPRMYSRAIRSMKNLSAFVTGNDLLLFTNYGGADPGVNGNTAGTRGVGAFGFDYGTLPAPLSLNFGIKASF